MGAGKLAFFEGGGGGGGGGSETQKSQILHVNFAGIKNY